ncbi:hypothetical protein ACGFZR_17230 [Streptomyces sp. NPDC048241]|uniref:hypothetical protein n=1 Tax=Streptomyces sp. NPDC048241 TaxID=3365521 RepID=UPI00371326AE
MPSGETYRAELDYLVRYTEMAPVVLGRIERGMRESEDPLGYVGICWFGDRAAQ